MQKLTRAARQIADDAPGVDFRVDAGKNGGAGLRRRLAKALRTTQLARLRRPRKIYIHVNNTNPMLNEDGPEFAQVREAGWEIAEDGWQFDL